VIILRGATTALHPSYPVIISSFSSTLYDKESFPVNAWLATHLNIDSVYGTIGTQHYLHVRLGRGPAVPYCALGNTSQAIILSAITQAKEEEERHHDDQTIGVSHIF